MLRSKGIGSIYNADTYDTYKDLCLCGKGREEKLLQGINLANGVKT